MSHKNKESLVKQVTDELGRKARFGQSKYEAKKDGSYLGGIYSIGTMKSYRKQCVAFAKYCKEKHKCKTLKSCREYVDEYLKHRSELSPYTVKLDAAALAKLYSCSTKDFAPTFPRHRADIKRSRGEAARDKCFSEANNAELVAFCRSTGLRRHEIEALRGTDLKEENGQVYVHVRRGKGGKERYARVIGDAAAVVALMKSAGDGKVFPKLPTKADIHGYRREYATTFYRQIARPVETLKREEKYFCRRDLCGVVYDRCAMLEVSRSLGHDRVDVIAGHYLYGKE